MYGIFLVTETSSYHHRAHSHSYPYSLRLGQSRHANLPHLLMFVGGRKLEYMGKSHTDRENLPSSQTVAPPGIDFLSSHHHYNEWTLNKTIFKNLLYFIKISLPHQSLNSVTMRVISILLISLSSDNYYCFLIIVLQCL